MTTLEEGAGGEDRDASQMAYAMPFYRPETSLIFRVTNRMLPPQPANQEQLQSPDLRRYFRLWHYALGLPFLVMFFTLTIAQGLLWAGFMYSPLAVLATAVAWMIHHLRWWSAIVLVPLAALFLCKQELAHYARRVLHLPRRQRRGGIALYSVGILNSMAMLEEQWFREGAENWTKWQRFRSCLGFGLAHIGNYFYPLSAILPLIVGGYLFMRVYLHAYRKSGGDRRAAVMQASLVHRVYNRIALGSMLVNIAYTLLALWQHWPTLL